MLQQFRTPSYYRHITAPTSKWNIFSIVKSHKILMSKFLQSPHQTCRRRPAEPETRNQVKAKVSAGALEYFLKYIRERILQNSLISKIKSTSHACFLLDGTRMQTKRGDFRLLVLVISHNFSNNFSCKFINRSFKFLFNLFQHMANRDGLRAM